MEYKYWHDKFSKYIKLKNLLNENKIPSFMSEHYNKMALHYFDGEDEAVYLLYNPAMFERFAVNEEGRLLKPGEIDLDHLQKFVLGMVKLGQPYMNDTCNNAWMIQAIRGNQKQGAKFGIFMYEVALYHAKTQGASLMPDRWSVSKDARGVWDIYDSQKRPDIKATPFDINQQTSNKHHIPQRTPDDDEDDCKIHDLDSFDPNDREGKQQNPLDKSYSSTSGASPAIIRALETSKVVSNYFVKKYKVNHGALNFYMMNLAMEFF